MFEASTANELYLLMLSLAQQSSDEMILRIFIQALNSIEPGLNFRYIPDEQSNTHSDPAIQIATLHNQFGYIITDTPITRLSRDSQAAIENSIQMLAIILENQYQKKLLANENLMLENAVEERTALLKESNQSLVNEITERTHAEENLRVSEENYRILAENMTDVISRNDFDGTFLYVSPSSNALLGYRPDEMTGRNVYEFMHPDDRDHFKKAVLLNSKGDRQISVIYRAQHRDGHILWLESSGKVVQTGPNFSLEIIASTRDVTQNMISRQQLQMSETRFRTVVESMGDLVFTVDTSQRITGLFGKGSQIFSQLIADVIGKNFLDMLEPGSTQIHQTSFEKCMAGEYVVYEATFQFEEQSFYFINSISPLRDNNGAITGAVGVVRDITPLKKTELALKESEERYQLATIAANDGVWDWDLRKKYIYYSPRWKEIIGLPPETDLRSPKEWFSRVPEGEIGRLKKHLEVYLAHPVGHLEIEHRIRHQNGSYRWVLVRGIALTDPKGKPYRIAGSMTDITARKWTEERLRYDAMHDPLTALPNRTYFIDQTHKAIERARRHRGYAGAILFMDLDRFKVINDSLGHTYGDLMLMEVCARLLHTLRPEDTVSRLGGDEFAILLENIHSIQDAIRVANRIQQELSHPFDLNGHEVFTSASIGIAPISSQYERPEDVLRDADTAMYQAKSNGRACFQLFDVRMHTRSMALMQLEMELRKAIERQEFELYYQPICSLEDGAIVSMEALVRWMHPVRGIINPGEFIGLAEETGLIVPLGQWILKTACKQAYRWQMDGYSSLSVAVNISARQFQDNNLREMIDSVLTSEQSIPAQSLQIEITESTAMQDFEHTIHTLTSLAQRGVKISIDDFGISYSSLGSLKQIPANTLKIDRSFIRHLCTDKNNAAITTAIIAMGHILGKEIIAEGVEKSDQLKFLMEQKCDQMQGYYLSRPLCAESATDFLHTNCKNFRQKLRRMSG